MIDNTAPRRHVIARQAIGAGECTETLECRHVLFYGPDTAPADSRLCYQCRPLSDKQFAAHLVTCEDIT